MDNKNTELLKKMRADIVESINISYNIIDSLSISVGNKEVHNSYNIHPVAINELARKPKVVAIHKTAESIKEDNKDG